MPRTYGLNKSKHSSRSYFTDCLLGEDQYGYHIYANYDHDCRKWIVFCEDHEPSELACMYPDTYKETGFDSLYQASVFIWEFVDDYYETWIENQGTEDQAMNFFIYQIPGQCKSECLTTRESLEAVSDSFRHGEYGLRQVTKAEFKAETAYNDSRENPWNG